MRNILTQLIRVKHVTEINAGRRAKGMISPCARINIEQLELLITGIKLVLDFYKPVVVRCSEEALRKLLQDRNVDSFYIGARPAELERMLAAAASNHFSDGFSIAKKCAICELLRSSARN